MTTACEQMSAAYERGRMSRDADVAQLVAALKAVVAYWNATGLSPCDAENCDCIDHVVREAIDAAEGR